MGEKRENMGDEEGTFSMRADLKKQKYYRQAFDLACRRIKGLDLKERAEKSGAHFERGSNRKGGRISLSLFNARYVVDFPDILITSADKKVVSLVTKIILLHYLINADGRPLSHQLIAYKEISGGMLYAGVFARRAVEPLIPVFGQSPECFLDAGFRLGGRKAEYGDVSFVLPALPRIPMIYILWKGDEEFSATVQLLFDKSVEGYLSLEDIVVVGEMAASRLIALGGVD
ncbi:MAG: DUF3786 domain-containing protein [Syntrophobacterales bacterium]|nr:MAG: DUF3786 domain-containing protein [Syntrophobacterales bacterium]